MQYVAFIEKRRRLLKQIRRKLDETRVGCTSVSHWTSGEALHHVLRYVLHHVLHHVTDT